MARFNIGNQQPFWTSVVLHLVVLVGLFLATIVEALRPEEKPHVFQMVDPAPSAETVPTETPPEAVPELEIPAVKPMRPIPDPVLPKPPPSPAPEETSSPPERASPTRRTISYEEFLRSNPVADPEPQRAPERAPVEVPRINTERVRSSLRELLSSPAEIERAAQMTARQQSLLRDYGARLNARLNAAWSKPPSLRGIALACSVTFSVSPSGRITDVRLNPSSGNEAFDRSVLAAFSKLGSAGPTPSGQSHSFTMTFRMIQ